MRQGVKDALNAVRFRNRKFAHALERSLVNIFLNCRILDIFLSECGVNCSRPGSEDIDAFEISHHQTAQRIALPINERSRKGITVTGIIHRQIGEICQNATAARSEKFVDTLWADQRSEERRVGK